LDILEIQLLTDSLEQTEKFYKEILGLPLMQKEQNSISFLAGSSILTFIKSAHLNPVYHFAFNIPNNKLDEALRWVSTRLELLELEDKSYIAHFDTWNARAFYFYDYNGNILEFIARYDLDNKSNKVFDGSSIQSVSEIGIVTDDVMQLYNDLSVNQKLVPFAKQEVLKNFAALGDDNGLLIISGNGRNWYPTKQKANKYFIKIRTKVEGMEKQFLFNE
jgi:catechol 2,3-dioxygenase-like lactoylglutathione lyase family enzyme